jgi:hypothetical protein
VCSWHHCTAHIYILQCFSGTTWRCGRMVVTDEQHACSHCCWFVGAPRSFGGPCIQCLLDPKPKLLVEDQCRNSTVIQTANPTKLLLSPATRLSGTTPTKQAILHWSWSLPTSQFLHGSFLATRCQIGGDVHVHTRRGWERDGAHGVLAAEDRKERERTCNGFAGLVLE